MSMNRLPPQDQVAAPQPKWMEDSTAMTTIPTPALEIALQHFNAVQCHHLTRLRSLFPEVSPGTLKNLLDLCQGDFIRTVDNILYTQRCIGLPLRIPVYSWQPTPSKQSPEQHYLPAMSIKTEPEDAEDHKVTEELPREEPWTLPELVEPTVVCRPENVAGLQFTVNLPQELKDIELSWTDFETKTSS